MGLGLTISKMILQKMGGDIQVESKPGVGSKFTFIIPIEVFENQPSNDLIEEEEEEKKQEDEEEKQQSNDIPRLNLIEEVEEGGSFVEEWEYNSRSNVYSNQGLLNDLYS